eukprot:4955741-Lingulodinium_polyedra.AAC.1
MPTPTSTSTSTSAPTSTYARAHICNDIDVCIHTHLTPGTRADIYAYTDCNDYTVARARGV